MARTKDKLPWITVEIKKLIKKRDCYYKLKKKSADDQTMNKYKELKRLVQRMLRRAYWGYIDDIVTPDDNNQFTGLKKMDIHQT